MREILFRGKRDDNGKWIEGCFLDKNNIGIFYDDSGESYCSVHIFSVDSKTVGQYTGLTDKNGNKIFEGDILEFSDRMVSVFWHPHSGCWDSNFLKFTNKENGREDMSPCRWSYRAKVVGNIHDNPELIGD